MKITLAKQDELEGIVEIYNQAIKAGKCTADTVPFSIHEREGWFENHRAEKFPLFVAKEKGELLGYLTLSPYRENRKAVQHTAEVSYYIHYDHHRKGVASYLMHHAIANCPSLKINNLIAILLGCNQASIQFLEKNGFKQWGCFPNIVEFDEDKVDHLYYGLCLN